MDIYKQVLNLFNDQSDELFSSLALSLFRFQAEQNKVYSKFLQLLNIDIESVHRIEDIPLLPISVYKNQIIKTGDWSEEKIFLSSGTAGMERSKNYIRDLSWYKNITEAIFKEQIGDINQYQIVALLPNYIDNSGSSLICMVKHFMSLSMSTKNEMFISEFRQLKEYLDKQLNEQSGQVLLIGVTFALLDFAKAYKIDSNRLDIMFTGGMKNKGKELRYEEVCNQLSTSFPSSRIFAEYGMTELCSQAYSYSGKYLMPSTMRVLPKDITDPLGSARANRTSRMGIIDLANIETCAFILTEDIGLVHDKHFDVIGRLEQSDLRGCNMLYHS